MAHPYLPKLKVGDNGLATPARHGNWDDGQAITRLSKLAKAIAVQPNVINIHSIPDPWARVILFDRALYDPTHSLHLRVRGEWRGLLAIFGLREIRRFHSLECQLVDLAPARDEGRGSFAKVLERLKPVEDELIDPKTTFERFYLLKWHGKPRGQKLPRVFAMTSPTTLVATGASYEDVLDPREIPWFDGEVLTDPTELLQAREKKPLAEWLKLLQSRLNTVHESSRRGWLVDLLSEFAEGLDSTVLARPDAGILSTTPLGLDEGLFRHLNYGHKGDSPVVTHVEIVTHKPGAPRYVLIDPDLAKQLDRDPNEIVVFGNDSLATSSALIEPKKTSGALSKSAEEMYWCVPGFFFQDSIIYESTTSHGPEDPNDAGAFPGCYKVPLATNSMFPPGETREVIFPITSEALKLFTVQELVENLEVQWLQDGSAVSRLTMEVQSVVKGLGPDGKALPQTRHKIKIEKKYAKEDTIRQRRLPPVCVWPDFRFEDDEDGNNRWKKYLLFESWEDLSSTEEFAVRPLNGDITAQRIVTLGSDKFQVYPVDRFPEVLVCQMPFGNKPRSRDDQPPQGLLLLKMPPPLNAGHGTHAILGVDFGTTGTCVYRSLQGADGRSTPTRVTFKNRLFPVTGTDQTEFRRLTRQQFIPGGNLNAGRILSVFQVFEEGSKDLMAVRDGHVLFTDEDAAAFIHGADGSIRSNMKWGDDQENAAAQSFLTQICIESLAELVSGGVDEVKVRYSYPTAFSRRDRDRWTGNWNTIIKNLAGRTVGSEGERIILNGVTSIPVELQNSNNCREAVSATRYFSIADAMVAGQGSITLDIGGGTTDIAVWNRNRETRLPKLMAHLSVLFAGRDLFFVPLSAKPEVLSQLDDKVPTTTLRNKLEAGSGDAYWAQFGAIIAAHGDRMITAIAANSSVPVVEEFLKLLEIGLCGIGFYSGLLVGRLIQEGSYRSNGTIPVFVGGNGSKLFHWCALGNFTTESSFHESFSNSLIAGVRVAVPEMDDSVEIHVSARPKEEVAYGLVAEDVDLEVSDKFTEPLAGERFIIYNGEPKPQEWYEHVKPENVLTSSVETDTTLPIFRKFLESLDRAHLQIEVTDQEIMKISGKIENALTEAAKRMKKQGGIAADTAEAASLRRSPIFFKALNTYLNARIKK